VYQENNAGFYDSMQFWNKNEGIAMGDPITDCLRLLLPEMAGHME
jgi:hypothetical protein